MKNRIYLTLAASLLAILLSSCAGGQDYSSVKASGALTPRPGKSMVLIYRTPGMMGVALKPYLYANGAELPSRLQRGGFYSMEVNPGLLQLATSEQQGESTAASKTKSVVAGVLLGGGIGAAFAVPMDIAAHRKNGLQVQALAGQTHYIVMHGAGGKLSEAEPSEAEEEITDCHWLNPHSR